LLSVYDLSISFSRYSFGLKKREVRAIEDLYLQVSAGQIMAVIGQSGAGKSLLAHALLGILPRHALLTGSLFFKGRPLTEQRLAELRGREIALIPQSITSLNPLLRVGAQVARAARLSGVGKKEVRQAVQRAFARYGLKDDVASLFPHQLSGGMARRVLTATATVGRADLIVADEPVNGLDAPTARETLAHLRELADDGKGVLLITHDIEAALQVADKVTVFWAGTTLEVAAADDFREGGRLQHPYTRALWNALPANAFLSARQPALTPPGSPGCPFRLCCARQDSLCAERAPKLRNAGQGMVRCHHA